jgi:hypothetical protein
LFAFSSNNTWPVSSEVTLIPTIAEDKSGLESMSKMRDRNSATFFVVSGLNEGVGDGWGDGEGDGEGLTWGTEL